MKISIPKNRLWLCLPVIVAEVLDYTVTMFGQPAEYWKGSYQLVNEFNPFAHWFMTIHPLGALVYIVLDIVATCVFILILPLVLSKVLAALWTIGSAKAIYNWLVGPLAMGWWISNFVLLIPTVILVYALDKASAIQTTPNSQSKNLQNEFPRKGY